MIARPFLRSGRSPEDWTESEATEVAALFFSESFGSLFVKNVQGRRKALSGTKLLGFMGAEHAAAVDALMKTGVNHSPPALPESEIAMVNNGMLSAFLLILHA